MARGLQSGYNMDLTQDAGTGPVNPALQSPDPTSGAGQLINTIFPVSLHNGPTGVRTAPGLNEGIDSPLWQNFGPPPPVSASGNFSVPKINSSTNPTGLASPFNRMGERMLGGGKNPFFK
jgi:hypothetical protein